MTLDEGELRNAYQNATRRRAGTNCPGEDTLIRAARHDLSSGDREAVIAHLAQCSDCARDYRIATALQPWANDATKRERDDDGRNASPFTIATTVAIAVSIPLIVWLFLARTGASRTIDQLYGEIAKRDQENRALRTQSLALRAKIEELSTPSIGIPAVDLDASANPTSIDLAPNTHAVALILHLPFPRAQTFELHDARGQTLWRDANETTDSASVTITVPRELVPSGDYVMRANSASDHADFAFRIR